jgi:transposase
VRRSRVLQSAFGLEQAVVEGFDFDERAAAMVLSVRPVARAKGRCGRCGRRAPRYDRGCRRRWRALDLGTLRVFFEADAPRVRCRTHGVTVAAVPWARHGAGHTKDFDDQAAWLAVHVSKSAVVELLRIAWRTVGAIVARVGQDVDARVDRLEGLVRIGVDEVSYKRGHRYLTVVVDHDSGRLVWAAPGKEGATLASFFEALGPQRTARLTHITCDMAPWFDWVLRHYAPGAVRCADPFHVVRWAIDALDLERRRARREASGRGHVDERGRIHPAQGQARTLRNARYALWKNPEHLSAAQHHQLEWIQKSDPRLYRAYLLKEGLRYCLQRRGDEARDALDQWLAWAWRSRLPAFVEAADKVHAHRPAIEAAIDSRLSNALVESTNTKIRLLTRVAYGFHGPEPLIALAMLALGGHCPALPGRNRPTH